MVNTDAHTAGLAAGVLSAACFGLTGALINIAADTLPATEITFARGVIGLLVISFFVKHRLASLLNKDAASVWVRAVAGAVSILCFSWNLQHTDVGTANILFNLSLIFVLFAEYVTGQARHSYRTVASVVLAVAGIVLYWHGNKIIVSNEVLALGLLGAVAATIAYTALNRASRKNDPWLIVWCVSLMSIPLSLLAKSGSWTIPSSSNAFILVAIAFGILIAHYLLNISFSKLSLPIATALGPSCMVWSVLGVTVFQGMLPPLHAALGMLIYVAGIGLLLARSKAAIQSRQDVTVHFGRRQK